MNRKTALDVFKRLERVRVPDDRSAKERREETDPDYARKYEPPAYDVKLEAGSIKFERSWPEDHGRTWKLIVSSASDAIEFGNNDWQRVIDIANDAGLEFNLEHYEMVLS